MKYRKFYKSQRANGGWEVRYHKEEKGAEDKKIKKQTNKKLSVTGIK